MRESLLDHVTRARGIGSPAAPRTLAASVSVCPGVMGLGIDGRTSMRRGVGATGVRTDDDSVAAGVVVDSGLVAEVLAPDAGGLVATRAVVSMDGAVSESGACVTAESAFNGVDVDGRDAR